MEDCTSFATDVNPTHLDSHMGCLFWTKPEIFQIYVELAREYGIPCLIEKNFAAMFPEKFAEIVSDGDVVVDAVFSPGPGDYAQGMAEYYSQVLSNLEPGLNMIIIHAGIDNAELQAVTVDHPDWGAAWRQADYDFFRSQKTAELITAEGIKLMTWREVGKVMTN